MDFIKTFIDQLQIIARNSKSIPAQMCGEAAELIAKITDHETLLKENQVLREEVEALRARIASTAGPVLPELFTPGGVHEVSSCPPTYRVGGLNIPMPIMWEII